MRQLRLQRGDTIIEVMVAFAVFAMVAIGALTVMNQGTSNAQEALETTLVRQQIDNQAEMLRFLHQAYLANPNDTTPGGLPDKFRAIVTKAKNTETAGVEKSTEFGQTCTQTIPGNAAYRFVLDPATGSQLAPADVRAADHASAPPYAQVTGGVSYGTWIEPILSNATAAGEAQYIDFHVRACWNSSTSSSPQRTLGTIVRLYVPENVDTGTSGGDDTSLPLPIAHNFTMRGSDRTACHSHADVESTGPEPTWNPADSSYWLPPGNPSWDCQTAGNEVYACVNYDSWFEPAGFTPASNGTYRMTIEYDDAISCAPGPILPPYSFKVAIYVNGTKVGSSHDLLAPSGSYTINNIGTITDTSVIQVRWWNNHWYNGTQDPDFLIKQIRIERIG